MTNSDDDEEADSSISDDGDVLQRDVEVMLGEMKSNDASKLCSGTGVSCILFL
jgi:hypothetical protein